MERNTTYYTGVGSSSGGSHERKKQKTADLHLGQGRFKGFRVVNVVSAVPKLLRNIEPI